MPVKENYKDFATFSERLIDSDLEMQYRDYQLKGDTGE